MRCMYPLDLFAMGDPTRGIMVPDDISVLGSFEHTNPSTMVRWGFKRHIPIPVKLSARAAKMIHLLLSY